MIDIKDIKFADSNVLKQYPDITEKVMNVIFPDYMFISDLSHVGDFPVDEEDIKRFSDEFEMIINYSTPICAIVKHLATRQIS